MMKREPEAHILFFCSGVSETYLTFGTAKLKRFQKQQNTMNELYPVVKMSELFFNEFPTLEHLPRPSSGLISTPDTFLLVHMKEGIKITVLASPGLECCDPKLRSINYCTEFLKAVLILYICLNAVI